MPRPRTQDNSLCEPAQSTCTSTFHKSHFIRKFTGKNPHPRLSPERRHKLARACAVEKHFNTSQCTEIYRTNAAPQNLGPHFARACAVEMHVNIYRKNAAPQNLGPHFARACAAEMHVNMSREPLYTEIDTKNAAVQLDSERGHALCASLRSRKALQHVTRATLYGNLNEKCRTPEPRTTLCASLRSRNACQLFTKAGNLQEKYRAPEP